MSEAAGTADVWVIANKPVERVDPAGPPRRGAVPAHRAGLLPSRAADNLFWLGRYLERAEATLRLVRALCTSLMDSNRRPTPSARPDRPAGPADPLGRLGEEALGERAPRYRRRRPAQSSRPMAR